MINEVDSGDVSPANVVRILVSTDNHLGYAEKHGTRGVDSFLAFEEVLRTAKEQRADFLLLGGDLFHDNKPSRNTTFRCMSLLRKYCFGDDPVSVHFCSDPGKVFDGDNQTVNYMDPFLSISLPIFTIHGNHDDPTGSLGPRQLSSVDLLHSAGMLNYFGKVYDSKSISIEPILLRKGSSCIALYGLGNVRDERLYTTWKDENNVQWKRPQAVDAVNPEAWFNIFVLHQNRVQRGTTHHVTESMLPSWLDFVIWGHEHECRIDLEGGTDGPVITQPGSTVATSMIEGESKEKCVGLLEVFQDQFKWTKLPLKNVRKFHIDDVVLSEQSSLHPAKPMEVEAFLRAKVEQMLIDAETEFDRSGPILDDRLRQPLIRLRVDYSGGFEIVSPQRFGQEYIGRIANSSDILLFHKRKTSPTPYESAIAFRFFAISPSKVFGLTRSTLQHSALLYLACRRRQFIKGMLSDVQSAGNDQEDVQVPDLVRQFLEKQENLEILPVSGLNSAVDRFVTKTEPHAIVDYVESQLKEAQKVVKKEREDAPTLDASEITYICERLVRSTEVSPTPRLSPAGTGVDALMDTAPVAADEQCSSEAESPHTTRRSSRQTTRKASIARVRSGKASQRHDVGKPQSRRAPASRTPGRARSRASELALETETAREESETRREDDSEGSSGDEAVDNARGSRKRGPKGFKSSRSARRRNAGSGSLHSRYDID
ncbi:hypothetical protein NDN08_003146 [Rhodosorus marinus]|uniref:Double-strand break repair protein n=1 Tax=Rhodosorus marinus TaxID=101924 RepID=A0AAV8V1I4_9RHOD|nr:hypothetical protein NDN08_003146 [Rhodosorus marinus]